MVKKASRASGPYCVRVVVMKICEPEISHKLADIYNVPEEMFFRILKSLKCGPLTYHPVSLLSVVSRLFEKLLHDLFLIIR